MLLKKRLIRLVIFSFAFSWISSCLTCRNLARQHGTTEWTLENLQAVIKRELEILYDILFEQHSNKDLTGFKKTNVLFAERLNLQRRSNAAPTAQVNTLKSDVLVSGNKKICA